MGTTTARKRRTASPIAKAWGLAKKLDNSEKLELMAMLIDSVKPIQTMKLFDTPLEEEFIDMDKELYTPEEAYELTMKDIKTIYER